jgi:hypothetical protein
MTYKYIGKVYSIRKEIIIYYMVSKEEKISMEFKSTTDLFFIFK